MPKTGQPLTHRQKPCPSVLQIDALLAGLLEENEATRLRKQIEACPECFAVFQRAQQQLEQMSVMPDFEAVVAQWSGSFSGSVGTALPSREPASSVVVLGEADQLLVTLGGRRETSLGKERPRQEGMRGRFSWINQGWRWLGSVGMVGACAVLFVLWVSGSQGGWGTWWMRGQGVVDPVKPMPQKLQGQRKGDVSARMMSILPGEKHSRWTRDREVLVPGTMVQFEVSLPVPAEVMVVGINQRGEVSCFVPLGGARSVSLKAGKHVIPNGEALELDDYLGWERVFVVTSKKPILFSRLKKDLQAAFVLSKRSVQLMDVVRGWKVKTLLFRKQRLLPQAPTKKQPR